MSTKHKPATPLPWRVNAAEGGKRFILSNAHGGLIAYVDRREVAEQAAHAANAYPRLVQSLKSAVASLAKSNHPYSLEGFEELLRELGEE